MEFHINKDPLLLPATIYLIGSNYSYNYYYTITFTPKNEEEDQEQLIKLIRAFQTPDPLFWFRRISYNPMIVEYQILSKSKLSIKDLKFDSEYPSVFFKVAMMYQPSEVFLDNENFGWQDQVYTTPEIISKYKNDFI